MDNYQKNVYELTNMSMATSLTNYVDIPST